MLLKRINRIINRIIEQPKILPARFKGICSSHCLCCLTVKDLLKEPAKTIIGVGANKGRFIDACKYVFPKSKIYAFEPIPELYNLIKNKKDVTAFNFGLWDKEGQDIFYCNKSNIGASSFLEPTEEYKEKINSEDKLFKIKASKKRFDQLKLPIERPCFVKVDAEGAEYKVIKGFGDRLKEVDILQIEWFFRQYHKDQMKLDKMLPLLEKYGFSGFMQKELFCINNIPSSCDLIFFKSQNKI